MSVAGEDGQAGGDKWGDDIPPERQAELEVLCQRQAEWAAKPEAERGESVFKAVQLTGADVFWLAARALAGTDEVQAVAKQNARLRQARDDVMLRLQLRLDALHLEGASLYGAHLEDAGLSGAHLEDAGLSGAHLEDAGLSGAHLEDADLREAHLEDASLSGAHLEGADLREAHLEDASLSGAHLEGADLREAHLEGAFFRGAHLEGAFFRGAHLEGKIYRPDETDYQRIRKWKATFPRDLAPADVRTAFFDSATNLSDVTLGRPGNGPEQGYVQVADVRWGGVNLAVAKEWPAKMVLGDERAARAWQPPKQEATGQSNKAAKKLNRKERAKARRQQKQAWQDKVAKATQERLDLFRAAVRANRQLATALRDQGMNEEADRFAYRAQVCQRTVLRLQRKLGAYLFSAFLDALAGYGYKPARSVRAYLLVVLAFATAYYLLGPVVGVPFPPIGALVFSMTSFHGRGFFPGGSPGHSITLDDPLTVVAACEALVGLAMEISFFATITNRFFSR